MKSNTSLVTARSRSKSIGSRLPEQDGGNRNALTICSDGKDIYSSILGPTADETLLLGLQTFLGFGSSGEDGSTRARIAGSTVQASEIEDKRKYSIAGGTSFGGESILGGETLLGADSILHGEILVGGESIVGGQGVVGGESMVGDQSLVGDVSLGGVSFGGVTGHASEGDATMSMKSRKVSPCKLKCPEKTYVEQGVQTLPPGYAIKCNKAVACPPRCRVGIQESGESILHLSDSMVGTDERFNFGGQTPGLRIGSSASQTGDLLNTSSSQTSRVNLSHASLQTQRHMDSATYIPVPVMSNKQLSTSSELLPGLEDCSCSTDSMPAIPIKRKQVRASQKSSLSRCSCGRSCTGLKRPAKKKKTVKMCCDCPSSTTGF
ncbi:unnamed protein product [Acanthoscelides obtectus]|uniref:Uncharacterized protein n=2 Tax=Acanthoscelides obtectus TaxID=200917 RepID=A0A9P0JNK3_ACAOB|nr:unnamed protein product [Acanthoscelides obtectus]CAK1672349.1 hypothetical protein AOBTE_LOCUS28813 [Acanthoscelides obtectus]